MELHLSRDEIVRTARALLGIQTDSSLAAAAGEQQVAMAQAAALEVAAECRWVTAQRRVTITLQIQQGLINYPDDCGAGSIMAMAVFDQNRYFSLESRIIPASADIDQQLLVGGDAVKGMIGRPSYFQQRQQIAIWPLTDKEYPLRIEYMAKMNLPTGTSISLVDGQLIIYKTAEAIAVNMSDTERAQYYAGKYGKRLAELRGWQSAGSRFALDREADMGEDEFNSWSDMPNWNRLPTSSPPVP